MSSAAALSPCSLRRSVTREVTEMTERTVKHRGTEERRQNGAEHSTRRREAAAHAGQERAHEPSAFPEPFVHSLLTGLSRRPALQAVRVECALFSVLSPFLRSSV